MNSIIFNLLGIHISLKNYIKGKDIFICLIYQGV